jgi:hypothetical protein
MSVKDQPPRRVPFAPSNAIRARLRRRPPRVGYLVALLLLAGAALAVFAFCACKSFRIGPPPDAPEITHGPP